MLRLRAVVLLLLCCICSAAVVAEAEADNGAVQTSKLVAQYLQSRAALLQQFSPPAYILRLPDKASEKDWAAQRRGLKSLETQLRAIIGPVHIAGFKSNGQINLESLRETSYSVPRRMMDGLIYRGDDGDLFVTTRELATARFNDGKVGKRRTLPHLQHHETLFFSFETAVMPFMPLPIRASGHVYIRTSLALLGQDSGPYPPGMVYVYIENKDYIFLLEHRLTQAMPQIPACEKKYNLSMQHGGMASHPWEPDAAFLTYKACFADQAKRLPFYKPVIKEVQAIVDHIMQM